jgi:hypothetical protein
MVVRRWDMPTVTIPRGAIEVLCLDDQAKWPGILLADILPGGRGPIQVTATNAQISLMRGEADARASGGWDQPLWYYRTCRAVLKALR